MTNERFVPTQNRVTDSNRDDMFVFHFLFLKNVETGLMARRMDCRFQMRGDQPMSKYVYVLTKILESAGYKGAEVLQASTSPTVHCNGNLWQAMVEIEKWPIDDCDEYDKKQSDKQQAAIDNYMDGIFDIIYGASDDETIK